MGKVALASAAPELIDIASGQTKTKAALKRVAKKTVQSQLGGGKAKRGKKNNNSRKHRVKKNKRAVDIFKNLQ